MDIRAVIVAIEAAAKEQGITVAELCRRVGVDRATWQRWKAMRFRADEAVVAQAADQVGLQFGSASYSLTPKSEAA